MSSEPTVGGDDPSAIARQAPAGRVSQFGLLRTRRLLPLFIHPVPGSVQRQPVQVRADADPRLRRDDRRRRHRSAGQCRRGAADPAVLPFLGHSRDAGGPLREVAVDPLRQARRNRRRRTGGDRAVRAERHRAAGRGFPAGRAIDVLRAAQVRDPAPAPAQHRAGRRQRHGGDGDPGGHPSGHHRRRHHRRRHRRGQQRQRVAVALGHGGDGGSHRVPVQPPHPAGAVGAPRVGFLESRNGNLGAHPPGSGEEGGIPVGAGRYPGSGSSARSTWRRSPT